MAKIRFGYSDDFTAKNSKVGINTTEPQTNLDVVGVVKGQNLRVTGVSSQTGYEGFLRADHQIAENTTLSFDQGPVSSLSGEIIVGTGQTVTVTENLKEDRLGPELITNGQFLFNVDDWTAYTSVNSFNNGRLRIARSGGNGWTTYQLITSLVPGATYFASAIVDSIESRGDFRIVNGNSWGSNYYLLTSGTNGQVKTLSGSFTATGTTALVGFAIDDNGRLIEVDQVTVRRVNDVEEPGTNVAGGSQVECMKVYNTFTPPSGDTNQRPSKPKPGQLYYNYDFKTIEFHDGYGWRQVDNTTRSGRSVFFGGYIGSGGTRTKSMDLITIPTLGNSVYFGDLESARTDTQGCSDGTRGLSAGGYHPSRLTDTEYITLASAGNSIQFGDLDEARNAFGGCSSSTRGLFAGGVTDATNVPSTSQIDYFQISTLGTALEFGQLSSSRAMSGGIPSSTRAVWGVGHTRDGGAVTAAITKMDYSTFASKGNATEFGDEILPRTTGNGCSSGTRGVFAGGYGSPGIYTPSAGKELGRKMSYITIASTGNAIEFGELSGIRTYIGSNSTSTRGIWTGGSQYPTHYDSIEYVQFSSLGKAIDFGNLHSTKGYMTGSASDSHGGLGGF